MTKTAKPDLTELKAALEHCAEALPQVTWKRMFGCDAAFAGGSIFGLIWKEGRIGVRLPETADFDALMAVPGAVPWKAGKMTMSHWVLVPETFHGKKPQLGAWVKKAHAQALSSPPKAKAPGAKKSAGSSQVAGAKKPKARKKS